MQRRTTFAAAGLLTLGVCLSLSTPSTAAAQGQGQGPSATAFQLRVCRSEADRRLAAYSYDQIQVESESRDQNVATVRWRAGGVGGAGGENGRCTVATNGRLLAFTRDGGGGGGGGGGNLPPKPTPGTTTRITCESRRTEREECRIPTGATIRLARQLSDSPCRLNDTYGQGPAYLWVAEGCRGEFDVTLAGSPGGGGTTRVTCESPNGLRRECPIPPGSQVRLVTQLSAAPCRPDQTYGTTPRSIWVYRGCRGVFEVTTGGSSGGNGYTTRIVCESQGAARQQCAIAGATQIRLVRQMSTSPCRLNGSYGIGFGHIWVSNGCRGEFEVTVAGAPPGAGLPVRVTCESNSGERAECRIRSGAQVQLIRQISTAACVRYKTWGTENAVLWVTKGCRGEFEVR